MIVQKNYELFKFSICVNVMLVYDNSIVLDKGLMTELVFIMVKYAVCLLPIQNIPFHLVLSIIPPKFVGSSFGRCFQLQREKDVCVRVPNLNTKKKEFKKTVEAPRVPPLSPAPIPSGHPHHHHASLAPPARVSSPSISPNSHQ